MAQWVSTFTWEWAQGIEKHIPAELSGDFAKNLAREGLCMGAGVEEGVCAAGIWMRAQTGLYTF